jgi:uncharacterized protein
VQRLPLFPLRTVLLPQGALPLHIFEERYKLMVARCTEERSPFGVVLIRSGEEAGATAEPYDVGTTARIAQVHRLPDGKMNLIAFGEQRFRIRALDSSQPYLQGDVELLASAEIDAPEVAELAARVSALFAEHFRLVLAISGQWSRQLEVPHDPDALADYIAGTVELPVGEKQSLLETLSLPARLSRLAVRLAERVRSLTPMWEEKRSKRFARN